MQFCLENGRIHSMPPFAIKRTILIGCSGGHFREAFCLLSEVGGASEVPPRQTERNLGEKRPGVDSEAYPECSPAYVYIYIYVLMV